MDQAGQRVSGWPPCKNGEATSGIGGAEQASAYGRAQFQRGAMVAPRELAMRVNVAWRDHRQQVGKERRHRGVFDIVILGSDLDLGRVGVVPGIGMECRHHGSFRRRRDAAVRKDR